MAQPPFVLVVDDNPDLRDGVAEILEGAGLAVATAPTADAALSLADGGARPPDAILLDLIMPGMPAQRFVSEMRDRAGWSRARIVLFSAAADYDTRGFPADEVLPKPFRVEQLFAALRRVGIAVAGEMPQRAR